MIPGGIVVNRTYLEDIILQLDGAGTQYVLTVAERTTRKGLQRLHIAIEGDPDPRLADAICHRVRVEYNHNPVVTILPPGTIPRGPGKAKRILTPNEYSDLVDPYAA
jgi:phenylacetate-coenzyme A ligase PaaK-like adenylate-forming protein